MKKNFINFNNAFFASFILFAIKSNDQFRLCVNYRRLNHIIKRNSYFILLIEKTSIKIIECKYIFKLNIISALNKLRMHSNNENLITFICLLNIYKYHVFSFELTNDSISFQHYMNDLLFEFLSDFCQVYLNDIFIYNKIKKKIRTAFTKNLQKIWRNKFANRYQQMRIFQNRNNVLRLYNFHWRHLYKFQQTLNHCELITDYQFEKNTKFCRFL